MHVNEPCQSSFFLKLLGNEKKIVETFFFFLEVKGVRVDEKNLRRTTSFLHTYNTRIFFWGKFLPTAHAKQKKKKRKKKVCVYYCFCKSRSTQAVHYSIGSSFLDCNVSAGPRLKS